MDLSTTTDQTFTVPASPDAAFRLVADVPDSVAHFPGLEDLEPAGPATWRWRLDKVGTGRLSLQTVYTCRYAPDPDRRTVIWDAVMTGEENARVTGSWTIDANGTGARLRLVNTLALSLPVPALMRRPAEALVRTENTRLVKQYIENLTRTLSGGDGRLR